jgi:hypothetical protein
MRPSLRLSFFWSPLPPLAVRVDLRRKAGMQDEPLP